MKGAERLDALEDALERLRRDADGALLVVEGRRDLAALRRLAIEGTGETIHHGRPLEAMIDEIAERAAGEGLRVILLLDWDRTGGRLLRRLWDGLRARVPVDVDHRRRLAIACRCKCIEDVPQDLAGLRRRHGGRP